MPVAPVTVKAMSWVMLELYKEGPPLVAPFRVVLLPYDFSMTETNSSSQKTTDPAPSALWWLAEFLTRMWAHFPSLLSIPGITTELGRPPLRSQRFRYTTAREVVYLASLSLALLGTFSSLGGFLCAAPRWHWEVAVVVASHQVIEYFVFMFRLGLFGGHAGYRPDAFLHATRKQRERTILVLMVAYVVTMLWFAVLYRAIENLDPKQIAVGSDVESIAGTTECFVLSFSTQTTVGYGTVAPVRLGASAVAATQAIFGVFYLALAVANVLSVLNVQTCAEQVGLKSVPTNLTPLAVALTPPTSSAANTP